MWVGVVSIFPDMFRVLTSEGVVARAIAAGTLDLDIENPRDHAEDRHSTVDDRPYGGGPGMVMKVEPLERAIDALKRRAGGPVRTVYLSPQGERLRAAQGRSAGARRAAHLRRRALRRHRRARDRSVVDEQISLGDFVLTGGELPVMVVIDAVARYLPGTLGNAESARGRVVSRGFARLGALHAPGARDGIDRCRRCCSAAITRRYDGFACAMRWVVRTSGGPDLLSRRALVR